MLCEWRGGAHLSNAEGVPPTLDAFRETVIAHF